LFRFIFLTGFLFFQLSIFAQNFELNRYGINEGLSIELTKSITQDNYGFIWVATDEGVSRFDGYSFLSFTSPPELEYAKALCKKKDGNILLVTDHGVFEIQPALDTAKIVQILQSAPKEEPGKVFYPKSIYEAKDGTIFIGEGGAIVRYRKNNFKRFVLSSDDFSFNFLRNHYFFELETGEVVIVTHQGGLFLYDNKNDKLVQFDRISNFPNITGMTYLGELTFIAGNNGGAIKFTLNKDQSGRFSLATQTKVIENLNISGFLKTDRQVYIITWDQGLFSYYLNDPSYHVEHVTSPGKVKLNDIFMGKNSEIWLSSERGILLLSKRNFNPVLPDIIKQYVQDIITKRDNMVYVSDGNSLYKLVPKDNEYVAEVVLSSPGTVIRSFARFNEGITVATSDGVLIHISDLGTITRTTPKIKGRFISFIGYGNNNDLWMLETSAKQVINLRANGDMNMFDLPFTKIKEFSTLMMNPDGDLYIGGTSDKLELVKYSSKNNKFTNIILKVKTEVKGDITINDIDFDRDHKLILATSHGVFRIDGENAYLLDPGFKNMNARSISCDNQTGTIWIGTPKGLYAYDGEGVSHFNMSSGLPSITIGTRTLTTDPKGDLWVGTAEGIAIMRAKYRSSVSEPPALLLKNLSLGVTIDPSKNRVEIPEDNNWRVDVLDFSYPVHSDLFQYKFDNDEDWINLKNTNRILLSDLSSGGHTLTVRVKPSGHSTWSKPTTIEFSILAKWYKRWWAWLLYFLAFGALSYIIAMFYAGKLRRENIALESLVAQRTDEISAKNEELTKSQNEIIQKNEKLEVLLNELRETNATKDKMMSIISHDLKNPFSTIMGFSQILVDELGTMDPNEAKDFIARIDHTARNTFSLLENLLAWSRSQIGVIRMQPKTINLSIIVNANISFVRDIAFAKGIKTENAVREDIVVMGDDYAINLILRNLLTNAIKFSYADSVVRIEATQGESMVTVSVIDEGVGMDEESIQKVMNPELFHSTAGTNRERGTGLGIILVKEMIEQQGGTLTIKSKPAKGSTFSFTLPVA